MNSVVFDFETTLEKGRDVRSLGARAYALHPETKVLLCGVSDGENDYCLPPTQIDWSKYHNWQWIAHNYSFEMWVFERLRRDSVLKKEVRPSTTFCTADMCAALGYPRSLKGAVDVLLGKGLSKDILKELKGKSEEEVIQDNDFYSRLTSYCLDDASYTRKIWRMHHYKWQKEEQKISRLSRNTMFRGVRLDMERLDEGVRVVQKALCEVDERIPWIGTLDEKGKECKPCSPKALNRACAKLGIPAPTTTGKKEQAFLDWNKIYGESAPFVKAMQDRRSVNRTLAFFDSLKKRSDKGFTYFNTKYLGAHTGRITAEGGLNMLNLPKEPVWGFPIRNIFVPRKGKRFIIADYANIEAVIAAAVVGHWDVVDRFEKGEDMYEIYARDLLNYTGPTPLKKHDPELRGFAKLFGLGVAYGAGAATVLDKSYLPKTEANFNKIKRAIYTFRSRYRFIRAYWDKLEFEMRSSIGGDHKVHLPSGRVLYYYDVKIGLDKYGRKKLFARPPGRKNSTAWWGGPLFENLMQAITRDLMRDSRLRLDRAGYTEVLEVYDEIVVETDRPNALKEMTQILEERSQWASEIPLRIGTMESDFYTK